MIIALEMMMIVAYGIYGASYGNLYPSPMLLFALFIVGIFAITPICCAIARCKE